MSAPRTRRLRARHLGRNRDRGASLPEYALAIALVAVASIGAIQYLQDRGEQRLSSSDARIGTPADGASYSGGGSGPGPTTPTTTAPADEPMTVGSVTADPPASNDGSKWIANATITVLDDQGDPLQGVLVSGAWTIGTGQPDSAQCTTGVTGVCSVQRSGINDNRPTAQFTVSTMSITGFTFTPTGGANETVVVTCPGSPATCD
jgi:hypothetical protein